MVGQDAARYRYPNGYFMRGMTKTLLCLHVVYFTNGDMVSHSLPVIAVDTNVLRHHTVVASWVDVTPQ